VSGPLRKEVEASRAFLVRGANETVDYEQKPEEMKARSDQETSGQTTREPTQIGREKEKPKERD